MAVVISDTTPLHYLILIGQDRILEKLYSEIIVPPAVFQELCHASAPGDVFAWMKSPPSWLAVRAPQTIPQEFDNLDFGERQALALAKEVRADWVLLDDKIARRSAELASLKVKGTLGVIADAAKMGLLDFRKTVEQLQGTSMHLDAKLVQRIIAEYEKSGK